ncbi:MAG: tetraacyldisaccharide 4'-kinase [Candidatus Avelusimicrobium sp.]|uniref:tetraacyldisaccharide 4'-kinase n=1 Tax=Candidatus Avelusimicrobium sp. TaxID=3048833 RepID=UPI003F061A8E
MDLLQLKEELEQNFLGRVVLKAASALYGAGVKLNLAAYEHGWKSAKSVNSRVVCIGNITAGGTGKTTAVLLAATALAKEGVRVSIVSRGYKRQQKTEGPVVLFDNPDADWRMAGDEPFMMSRVLSQYKVPIVISENRAEAATEALRRFKSQIVLLDDGFQHHRLHRDANIVLVDAKNPFGNKELLPYGVLREPLSALKRASLVVLTHCDQVSRRQLEDAKDVIREYNDCVEILESVHEPEYYFDICRSKKVDLTDIKGPAVCFCALGHPATFEATLEKLGLELKQKWRFPDHQFYTEDHLRTFEDTRAGLPIITTFKDFVKFPDNWREILTTDVYVLSVNLKILGGETEMNKFTDVLYPNFSKIKNAK